MKKKYYVIILILLILIFWNKLFSPRYSLYTGDFLTMSFPWKYYLHNSIENGIFPFYNPFVFGGTGFLANIQAAIFFPVDIFFYFIEPFTSFKITFFLNYILSAVCMFFLLKELEFDNLTSFYGSVLFIFSWFIVYYAPLKQVSNVTAFIPAVFLFALRLVKKEDIKSLCLLSVAVCCQLTGGHIQFAYYTLLFLLPSVIFWIISRRKLSFSLILKFTVSLLLAVMLSAVQLLPTYFYSNRCITKGKSYGIASEESVMPCKIVSALFPDFFGNISDGTQWGKVWRPLKLVHTHSEYITVIGLFFLIISISNFRKKEVLFYWIMFILIFCMAFGKYFFVYRIFFYTVPGFSYFRSPHRLLCFTTFFGVILSCTGFKFFLKNKIDFKKILKYCLMSILILVIMITFLVISKKSIINKTKTVFHKRFIKKNIHYHSWNFYEDSLNRMFDVSVTSVKRTALILIMLTIILYLIRRNRRYILLLFVLLFIDIYTFNYKFVKYIKNDIIKDMIGKYRFEGSDNTRVLPLVPLDHAVGKNGSMLSGIYGIKGYTPLVLKDFSNFVDAVETQKFDVHPNTVLSYPELDSLQLDLLNVKYLLSENEINNTGYAYIKKINELYLYENKNVLPHFKIYHKYNLYKNNKLILDSLTGKKSDIENVFLADKEISIDEKMDGRLEYVKNIEYKPGLIKLKGYSNSRSVLFISEIFSKEWQVTLNDKKVYPLKINYMFTGVPLEKGEFTLKMEFLPAGFKTGMFLSLSALFVIAAMLCIATFRPVIYLDR